MTLISFIRRNSLETLVVYWELVRIIVPVAIVTRILQETGAIAAMAPALAPVMGLYGLPADLAFAWLTGMLVGVWGAVPMIFALVPAAEMSVADMTVFSALLLFTHGLPIEQKIIQKAGPGFWVTTVIRLAGGMLYAAILQEVLAATGWLSETLDPAWSPIGESDDWLGFLKSLTETLFWMLVILVGLAWFLDLLKLSGLMDHLDRALGPFFALAGIHGSARQFTALGLFLGISYGGGFLIREARAGTISPRQILVSCIFMGFAHGMIEDTLIVMALGADFTGVFVGRLVFAVGATALLAWLCGQLREDALFALMFNGKSGARAGRGGGCQGRSQQC